jgi:hypothetical protein
LRWDAIDLVNLVALVTNFGFEVKVSEVVVALLIFLKNALYSRGSVETTVR